MSVDITKLSVEQRNNISNALNAAKNMQDPWTGLISELSHEKGLSKGYVAEKVTLLRRRLDDIERLMETL